MSKIIIDVYSLGFGNIIRVVKIFVNDEIYIFESIEDNGIDCDISLNIIPKSTLKIYKKNAYPYDKVTLSEQDELEILKWFKLKTNHILFRNY